MLKTQPVCRPGTGHLLDTCCFSSLVFAARSFLNRMMISALPHHHHHPGISGFIHLRNQLPFGIQRLNETKTRHFSRVQLEFKGISGGRIHMVIHRYSHRNGAAAGSNPQPILFDDKSGPEPFMPDWIMEILWVLRSLFAFLVEQPGQLKYIEWPSFKSTLKTATLTLILVAVIIVVLSSIDSVLSYLLALWLRRLA